MRQIFLTEEIFGAMELDKRERIFRYEVVLVTGLIGLFGCM